MRARVAVVAAVASGLFAIAGLSTPGTTSQLASRGGHGGEGGHDNGQQDNTYSHSCTSNDHHVISNVCVIVDDLPILGHILTGSS
jgi:hypothetical protein